MIGVQGVHETSNAAVGRAATGAVRGIERVVVVRHDALIGVRGEIGPQPGILRRARGRRDVAVERDDMPGAELEAVITSAGGAGRGSEVGVIRGGPGRGVLVIPGAWLRARLVPAPGRIVTVA